MIKNKEANQPTNSGDEEVHDPGEGGELSIKVLFLNFLILSTK